MILQNIKNWSKKLKNNLNVLYCAYMHKRTPWYAKIMIGIVIAYALSPIDLIPDFIPILGYLDDLLLIPLGIVLSFKLIPGDILDECKENAAEGIAIKINGRYAAIAIIITWIGIIYFIAKNYF